MPSRNWSREEVEATVQDYLDMLSLESQGEPYDKKAHNRRLRAKLDSRSSGAVEFKHQNISAVLEEMGLPYISGYKPRRNVQKLLRKVVEARAPSLPRQLTVDIATPQQLVVLDDVLGILVPRPDRAVVVRDEVRDGEGAYDVTRGGAVAGFDFVRQEAKNQSLGDAGETLVLSYERARLRHAGKDHLAHNVEHVAKTQGDHAGYDIRSYDDTGRDRFVEVKTTRYGQRTPFYISANELSFSKANAHAYHLYRVFDYREHPKLFTLPGDVAGHVRLNPVNYRARF